MRKGHLGVCLVQLLLAYNYVLLLALVCTTVAKRYLYVLLMQRVVVVNDVVAIIVYLAGSIKNEAEIFSKQNLCGDIEVITALWIQDPKLAFCIRLVVMPVKNKSEYHSKHQSPSTHHHPSSHENIPSCESLSRLK